jgi:SecD/SecF fusion protein
MQAKGFIRIIIVALIVVSIFQLSFTLVKNIYVNKAETYAQKKVADLTDGPIKSIELNQAKNFYLDSIKNEEILLGFTYDEIDKRSLNLGLDLKGGVSMLVEIDQADVLRKLSNESKDPIFNQAITAAIEAQANSQDDFITLFGKKYEEISSGAKLSKIFESIEKFRDKITPNSSNEDVLDVLKKETYSKNDETHNILTTRIDQFGVAQPFISEPDANGRIYIELPGAENTERIRKIIQTAAVLEFYRTEEASVAGELLAQVNDIVAAKLGLDKEANPSVDTTNVIKIDSVDNKAETLTTVKDDSLGLADLTNSGLDSPSDSTEEKAFNPLFEIFQANITNNENQQYWSKGPVVGFIAKNNVKKFKEFLEYEEVKMLFNAASIKIVLSAKPEKDNENKLTDVYSVYALKKEIDGKSALSGDVITDANPQIMELGKSSVSMKMNATGANKWAALTSENINKQIAIVLDDKVFSAPVVNTTIADGNSMIEGLEDYDEAQDLANILKSGRLDAAINIPQEAVVGASLGDDAIRSGLMAMAIGLLSVVLFMVLYYNKAGWIANLALLVNIIFIMGTLASLGAALTLPGLAGIVLTIGMAVDANVIIYERIKEELRKGKAFKMAVSDGFSRSYSAIIDSNVTTFITAATLMWLGAGPVKGFAIVLMIGIIASFISAVFLARLVYEGLADRDINVSLSFPWSEKLLSNIHYDFIGKRKIAYAISGIIILLGLASIFTKGFELGVDFKGGRSYVVEFDQAVSTDGIRSTLETSLKTPPTVKTFGNDRTVQIVTSYEIDSKDKSTDSIVTNLLYESIKGEFASQPSYEDFLQYNLIQSNKVDTSIADDIQSSALWAGIVGSLLIFIYLLIRFRKWQFGFGALVAVIHDALVLLAVFSILHGDWFPFSLEIEQKFIAAILTVIGYSINDTVIVYDRIRENMEEHLTKDLISNVNSAINDTLSRTLMTSFTTLLVVIILFIFGGEAIRAFSFALLVGISVGTYSSIFVASAIVVDTMKGKEKLTEKK